MIEDIHKMVKRKPEINGMKSGTHAGHTEIELKMAVAVQGKAGHMIPFSNSQRVQGMGKLTGSFVIIPIGVSENLVGINGDNFFFGKIFGGPQKKCS
jgi:hypothetical protein